MVGATRRQVGQPYSQPVEHLCRSNAIGQGGQPGRLTPHEHGGLGSPPGEASAPWQAHQPCKILQACVSRRQAEQTLHPRARARGSAKAGRFRSADRRRGGSRIHDHRGGPRESARQRFAFNWQLRRLRKRTASTVRVLTSSSGLLQWSDREVARLKPSWVRRFTRRQRALARFPEALTLASWWRPPCSLP